MFEDRKDAGKKLAKELEKYKDKDVMVLAVPKGGVEVGFYVAQHLEAYLGLVVVRKLPLPDNPESGFGAIAEDGSTFIYDKASFWVDKKDIDRIKAEQIREIKRRIEVLRENEPLPDIEGKTVILVDDGLAMGSTMRAAITLCRNKNAESVIVAVPVAGADTISDIEKLVDEVIVLESPTLFRAVAQVYKNWHDVSDKEVISDMRIMKTTHKYIH